jgi:hypothetical protein
MDYFRLLLEKTFLNEGIATVSNVNDAIDNLKQVEIRYNSGGESVATGRRIIYPVAYGVTKSGNPVIRAFEPYGDTKTKTPAWKFFRLDRIKNWRPLSKTFDGSKLQGFNENGDESMSIVYNIANIGGHPKKVKFPKIGNEPITKSDISSKEREGEINTVLKQGEQYGSEEIVQDLMRHVPQGNDPLQGIKAQVNNPNRRMVSPEMIKQIEKDNARKKLAQAKKQGVRLDNEDELLNIIKGGTADKINASKTEPITKDKIANSGVSQTSGIKPAGSGPITKNDIENDVEYEISNDDIDAIRKEWGLS